MGTVWLAEPSDGIIKRPVALKVPIASPQFRSLGERFARERDILAELNHPNIARLYDAGLSIDNYPYLALEYVEGEPITDYSDRHRLNIDTRLQVFIAVLRAVQYAHSNLVVHRDLKPSNILVTSAGEVKLLDFGIAKLLVEGQASETELTRIGGRVMTPSYASPEQIRNDAVTTASDVYSLGVILYELLSGERPYRLKRDTLGSLEDAILKAEVVRPSQAARSNAAASARSSTPKHLARVLKGDLDAITLKSLQKQPQHRYATADAFAQDIEHSLAGEPVVAQGESTWYRARKFVLRNTLAVASSAAVMAALGIGLGIALWQAHIAVAEKRRADAEAATSQAVNEFLRNDLLGQASPNMQEGPNSTPDPNMTMRAALDRAAVRIPGRFARQPLVEASVRQTMADTYRDLGLYEESQRQVEGALSLRRRILGEAHPDTLRSMSALAWLYREKGEFERAEALSTRVLERSRRVLGAEHPETLESMLSLAWLYQEVGKYAQSEVLFLKTLEVDRRVLGQEHPSTLDAMSGLASVYLDRNKYPQAEPLYLKLVDTRRRLLGAEHPDTLSSMHSLAELFSNEGRPADAEQLESTVLAIRRRVLGVEHPDTLISMTSMAIAYTDQQKYQQAEQMYIQILEIQRRTLGVDHPDRLANMNNLGLVYRSAGEFAKAEPMLAKVLEVRLRIMGPNDPRVLLSMANLGSLYQSEGKYARAEPLVTKALESRRRLLGEGNSRTLESMGNLGVLLRSEGKYTQAEVVLQKTLEARRELLGPLHPATLATMYHMAILYERQGRYPEAEALLAKLLEGRRHTLGPGHADTADAMASMGEVLFFLHKYKDAEQLLEEALLIQARTRPNAWERYHTESTLGASLAGQKKYHEAEPLLVSGLQGLLVRKEKIPFEFRPVINQAKLWKAQLRRDSRPAVRAVPTRQ